MCLCSPTAAKGGFASRCPVPDHVGTLSPLGSGGWTLRPGLLSCRAGEERESWGRACKGSEFACPPPGMYSIFWKGLQMNS